MIRRHIFVRRDGTTFEERVEAGAMSVEMYYDPETSALRAFAAAMRRARWYPKARGVKSNLNAAADRLWHVTQGRYGWPKGRR